MFRRENGELRWGSYGSNIIDINGEKSLLVVIDDITDRKKAEDKIQILLNETHHRVKNNMNTVYGLLYMQADEVEDPQSRSIIKDAAWRVQNMMLLYDKLYKSDNIHELNIKDYLTPLIEEIAGIFDPRIPVKRDIDIEEIVLNAKIISALGIIINELITNSMKYAFKNVSEGLIHLYVTRKDNEVTLIYFDNGPGLPESFNFENSPGFGMQLLKMMFQQIKGTIEVDKGESGRFTIRFSI